MNYTPYHMHTDSSLLDSCTKFEEYIDKAVECGMTAIGFSEHGNISQWFKKMQYCKSKGIKYIHGVECYLTENPSARQRDNYHTILIAKNAEGFREINNALYHTDFYYRPRISFDDFLALSNNVITTSACIAGPLNKLSKDNPYYEKLINRYDFLEIQHHNDKDQIAYNIDLACIAEQYGKPLIAGTDTHSINQYKAECREILMEYKDQHYAGEENFDMVFKTYDELIHSYEIQNALPQNVYMQAIMNTNVMADTVEDYDIDTSIKYPILYGTKEADHEKFIETIERKFADKVERGIIPTEQVDNFRKNIDDEVKVFTKIGMDGFMLSMAEILDWCHQNGIVTGTARGSVGGSRVAYVTDIIDLNPEDWGTVFSRFCNEDRVEVGDIDIDIIADEDRPKVFEYIINRFGKTHCARVSAFGTIADRAAIDVVGGYLCKKWEKENHSSENPYSIANIKLVKKDWGDAVTALIKEIGSDHPDYKDRFEELINKFSLKYPEIFNYYKGLRGVKISQSVHPAGMVIAPIDIVEAYGAFDRDGENCLYFDMDECHDVGLVKYDFLGLTNVKIIKETCQMVGIPYPTSSTMNWDDEKVWNDMLKSQYGIFQMESDFAFSLLNQFKPRNIKEMSLITAAIRPAGDSYRNDLMARKYHKNSDKVIDDLLKENYGYLIYQEDVIKFLQDICGFTASEADTMRRAIAKKKMNLIEKELPKLIEGYCSKSTKPRDVAEQEVKEFVDIIRDSSRYMFGYNHSIAYCLVGYICAYLRYYHPVEFITALLNNAKDSDDTQKFTELATTYGITIVSPKFGVSKGRYSPIPDERKIAKGLSSIKGISDGVADDLMTVSQEVKTHYFVDVLLSSIEHGINSDKIEALIKIDFFDRYGNSREVMQIYRMFKLLGGGKKMSIPKSDITNEQVKQIVNRYTNFGLDAKGRPSQSYKFTSGDSLIECMQELETFIKGLHLTELAPKLKIANYMEILGYVPPTNSPDDRTVLIITEITPIKGRNGQVWQYRVNAQSLGSGKTARLSVSNELYNNYPIQKGSVVKALNTTKDEKGYWHLANYNVL